jgi:hypothetical protein
MRKILWIKASIYWLILSFGLYAAADAGRWDIIAATFGVFIAVYWYLGWVHRDANRFLDPNRLKDWPE